MELRTLALQALATADIGQKLALTQALPAQAAASKIAIEAIIEAPATALPGRPARPPLVPPTQVAQRGVGTLEGRAALIHAICHIEFNAINLALDAIWRFAGLPEAYYRDWLRVAVEEAQHFQLLHTLASTQGRVDCVGSHSSRTPNCPRLIAFPWRVQAEGSTVKPLSCSPSPVRR